MKILKKNCNVLNIMIHLYFTFKVNLYTIFHFKCSVVNEKEQDPQKTLQAVE
jgi:hypothetical protein